MPDLFPPPELDGGVGEERRDLGRAPGKSEKPLSPYPSRLEGLVWIRLGFSSDFPQELGLYA